MLVYNGVNLVIANEVTTLPQITITISGTPIPFAASTAKLAKPVTVRPAIVVAKNFKVFIGSIPRLCDTDPFGKCAVEPIGV